MNFVCVMAGHIVEKRKKECWSPAFSPFPHCFQKGSSSRLLKVWIFWLRVHSNDIGHSLTLRLWERSWSLSLPWSWVRNHCLSWYWGRCWLTWARCIVWTGCAEWVRAWRWLAVPVTDWDITAVILGVSLQLTLSGQVGICTTSTIKQRNLTLYQTKTFWM